ncbi:hypothetical protein NIIDMKKI_52200 [Mycobacterium kansasii]|uniref:Membrane transport protein MMPL domain-containing protein n=1 Tax=Mycobacterium kansasii TaxID=1768 RepID=A0A7G1IHU1_MYCKA|nr:hypothetical protein NIIDMKKI_52200 [Mycobacterium kansasii]
MGGADAQALDVGNAAAHDRRVLIPAILMVILLVLYALLRAALAPPTLLAATILGALAALGLGGWASIHVFGFPALDNSTPLFAFLFLAALGSTTPSSWSPAPERKPHTTAPATA